MIKEILYQNLKGQSGKQKLTGKDIFIGRNGVGKTTRIQSLGLSMLGYVPGNGKTAQETFKWATGMEMTSGLVLENFQFARVFEKQEKYDKKTGKTNITISENVVVMPGQGETNNTQKKMRIEQEIGSFPVMLDFNNFLELSDAKRRDFIYSLSPIASNAWNRERIRQHLLKLLNPELKENNLDHYQIMESTIDEVMDKYPVNYEVSAGLQAMIDWVTVQLSAWNSKQKDSQGAVRQIADLKNEQEETDRNIAEQKKELEDLQKQLLTLSAQVAKDKERKKIIEQRLTRIGELKALIMTPAPSTPIDIQAIKNQIAELEDKLLQPMDIEVELKPLKESEMVARQKYEMLQNEDAQLQQKVVAVNEQIKTLKEAFQKAGQLGGRCILHHAIECTKDFSGAGEYLSTWEKKAVSYLKEYNEKRSEKQQIIQGVKSDIEAAQKNQEEVIRKAQGITQSNALLQSQISGLQKQCVDVETANERHANQIGLYREELTRLMNQPTEAIGDIVMMEKQIQGLKLRIEDLSTSIKVKEKAQQTILLLNQSMLENKKAELKAASLKSISEKLGPKGVQGELVKEVLEPIKLDIQSNLLLMGFDFEPFFQTESETGKEIFQFGWINEKGHMVNFDAMSAGQQVVFLAAMMMTIIDRAQPKLRILVMDNLNHLDRQNFQLLIAGLSKITHKLDNTILAGAIQLPDDEKKKADFMQMFDDGGWRVWNLSEEETDGRKIA